MCGSCGRSTPIMVARHPAAYASAYIPEKRVTKMNPKKPIRILVVAKSSNSVERHRV